MIRRLAGQIVCALDPASSPTHLGEQGCNVRCTQGSVVHAQAAEAALELGRRVATRPCTSDSTSGMCTCVYAVAGCSLIAPWAMKMEEPEKLRALPPVTVAGVWPTVEAAKAPSTNLRRGRGACFSCMLLLHACAA